MFLDRGEFRMKKISRLFLIALVGVFLLTGCTGKAITFDEAKAQAQKIDAFWKQGKGKIPAKSTVNYEGKDPTLDGRIISTKLIQKYDSDAKFVYEEKTLSSGDQVVDSEQWVYYDKTADKTYLAVSNYQGKLYQFASGDHFTNYLSLVGLYVVDMHENMGVAGGFNQEHTEGKYNSKGDGSLYGKFTVMGFAGLPFNYEINIQDYLIQKLSMVSASKDFDSKAIYTFTYKSFSLSKPNLDDYTLVPN